MLTIFPEMVGFKMKMVVSLAFKAIQNKRNSFLLGINSRQHNDMPSIAA